MLGGGVELSEQQVGPAQHGASVHRPPEVAGFVRHFDGLPQQPERLP